MFAAAEGKSASVPVSVGREFIAASHGLRNLPEHVRGKEGGKRGSRGKSMNEKGKAGKQRRRVLFKRKRVRDMGSR